MRYGVCSPALTNAFVKHCYPEAADERATEPTYYSFTSKEAEVAFNGMSRNPRSRAFRTVRMHGIRG